MRSPAILRTIQASVIIWRTKSGIYFTGNRAPRGDQRPSGEESVFRCDTVLYSTSKQLSHAAGRGPRVAIVLLTAHNITISCIALMDQSPASYGIPDQRGVTMRVD